MSEKSREYTLTIGASVVCACVILAGSTGAKAESSPVPGMIAPMRQDALRLPPVPEILRTAPQTIEAPSSGVNTPVPSQLSVPDGVVGGGYDPSGRRDPFAPIVQELQPGKADTSLPPLQRVTLTELNLIAIVWGAYGYTAMVQTPDGYGYTVRRGTRVGQNNGVVSAVTERGIIVQERFTDVYGKKQEREHVKLLHPKEGSE
jgi:type IV pilus assembly protein PilP